MNRWIRLTTLALALTCAPAVAGDDFSALLRQLDTASDFRVRVQAALTLGKTSDGRALKALTSALNDKSAAVRAAAAAALKNLGDPAALDVLHRHKKDSSSAVRRQVMVAIMMLEKAKQEDLEERRAAKVLVKLGLLRNATSAKSSRALAQASEASRRELDRLDGVALLNPSEDADRVAERHKLPVVLLTGSIRKLEAQSQGQDIVYSAQVEYVVHKMPDQVILAKVSGSASARAFKGGLDRDARSALRTQVIEGAVASAIKRSPKALLAASM